MGRRADSEALSLGSVPSEMLIDGKVEMAREGSEEAPLDSDSGVSAQSWWVTRTVSSK